jgi:hypothetical protein
MRQYPLETADERFVLAVSLMEEARPFYENERWQLTSIYTGGNTCSTEIPYDYAAGADGLLKCVNI